MRCHRTFAMVAIISLATAGCSSSSSASASAGRLADPVLAAKLSDQDVSDAYIYLLGRLLVTNQQQKDFAAGMQWNQLVHRKPGAVDWPNPNLDVAYSEAWVTVDEDAYVLVTVPKVEGRYYVMQFLNGWGETLANINPRVFPDHPSGQFAVCLKGSKVRIPAGAQRVDLPEKIARVLSRVELGANWDDAVALQKQFAMKQVGEVAAPGLPKTPVFDIEKLPGVEAFEASDQAFDPSMGGTDINPGMEKVQADARAIATAVKADPAERARIDGVIRTKAWADYGKAAALIGHGVLKTGWVRPSTAGVYGGDWLVRTIVDFGGLWANTFEEVIYFKCSELANGEPLHSDHSYTLTFPKDALPVMNAKFFWSVIAVDGAHMRVLPNPINRFTISNQSKLTYNLDGSLTIHFAPQKPADAPDGNWLPTEGSRPYRLTFRFYGPLGGVKDGTYWPPALARVPNPTSK